MLVSEPFNLQLIEKDLLKTPPAISRPIEAPVETQGDLSELSFSFNKDGATYNVSFPKAKHFPRFTLYKTIKVDQFIQNGTTCGPTSVLMALSSLEVKASFAEVCKVVDYNSAIGTNPISIRDGAESFGIRTSLRQNVTPTCLANILDAKGVGIALIEQGSGLHYVVVNGLRESKERGLEVSIVDPNGSKSGWQSWDNFCQGWDSVNWRGFETGLSRCLIVFGKEKIVEDNFSGQAKDYSILHKNLCKLLSLCSSAWSFFDKLFGLIVQLAHSFGQGEVARVRDPAERNPLL